MNTEAGKPLLEDIEMVGPEEGIDIDDVFTSDPTGRRFIIEDLLEWAYVKQLHLVMRSLAKKYCNGCHYDSPSQIDHDVCVMMSFEEQVDTWFSEALQIADEDWVIGHWFGTLGQISPTVRYHEVSKYLDPVYRCEEWMTQEWKSHVKERLVALEYQPF